MKLMVIESKGKIEKLSAILGGDWKVVASLGHVRDLPEKEIGVAAPDFKPAYQVTERGERIVKQLKDTLKSANQVFLATDPDREGESISWHLRECLKVRDYQRVTFNEITAAAVKRALLNPRAIDGQKVAAQEARRVLDRLFGYLVSPALSDLTGQRMSAGRVQSVAVRLVVDRERAIRAFKSVTHYGAELKFSGEWAAQWQTKPDFVSEDEPYFLDQDYAAKVAAVGSLIVNECEEGEAKRSPPPPFITSTLQQAASVALGMDPKETMATAQSLYEQGHITYHRTDNPNVSDESLGDIYAVAVQLGLDMAEKPRKFKAKEGAQEGHPAITPTHWDVEEAGNTAEERAIYKLIRTRAIACQLADARYAVRKVVLGAVDPVEGRKVTFEAKGRTLVYQGWLKLLAGDQTDEDEGDSADPANPVPKLTPGDTITPASGRVVVAKTKAPKRFTKASLVGKLESEGIGRPATYAAIMDNIFAREYVREEKRFLVPTPTGELIVDSLVGKFEFMELGYTRGLERELDRIEKGEAAFRAVVGGAYEQLKRELATLQASAPAPEFPCPECGKTLRRIRGKTGHFWGCSGYPECATSLPDDGGKPGKKEPPGLSTFVCKLCESPLVHRIKQGKGGYNFWGCSAFKASGCKGSYPDKNGTPNYEQSK